jgi:TetR/AcrR family transcriptional repressor of nem operon
MPRPSVRDKLVASGLEEVRRRGFNASGVQDITRAAGVPKGSFYNHFESKEAFGVAVLEEYWRGAAGPLAVLRDRSLAPLERLRKHFDALAADLVERDYEAGCLVGNFEAELSSQSPLVRERLSGVLSEWGRAVEGCVREAQEAGEARADLDPGALAAFLIDGWEGAVLRTKVERDGRALRQFDQIVFSAISA